MAGSNFNIKEHSLNIQKLINKVERFESNLNSLTIKREMLRLLHERVSINQKEESVFTKQELGEDDEEIILKSLHKLDQIKELAKVLRKSPQLSDSLASSFEERARYFEDQAYDKLENFLKLKMKDFESPLTGDGSFLVLIKITLNLLKH